MLYPDNPLADKLATALAVNAELRRQNQDLRKRCGNQRAEITKLQRAVARLQLEAKAKG